MPRTPVRMLLAALLGVALPLAVPADEPPAAQEAEKAPAKDVSDGDAKTALERFEREFETQDLDLRLEAMERLRKVMHPKVADRLLGLALKHDEALVRAEAFKGLSRQVTSSKGIGARVAKFLSEEAEASRKAKARGNYGLPLDVKTGEPVTDTPEGQAALRAKRERGRMLAEAVRCIHALDYRSRDGVETLLEFLQDGNDDLVALVLDVFGRWKEWSVLNPDVRDLFDMYPKEDYFETGSVTVDTGAAGNEDSAAAKRKWMAKFGDPDKRRPRPKVVRAIKKAILDITGEEVKTPEEFREFLKRPDVKRKVKGR